jgi:tetratricopeptide (TPR) repeat protein
MYASDWTFARSPHFEVCAQNGPDAARKVARWFERARLSLQQRTGLTLDGPQAVRVLAFRSPQDYDPYRIRPTADAYYAATDSGDYIVMVDSAVGDFEIVAHEYWHYVEHTAALRLPPWLNEGLAEVFSAGAQAGRLRILRVTPWLPLPGLLALAENSPLRDESGFSNLFYAQSWALADMLLTSPSYAAGFPALMASLTAGASSEQALRRVYQKPLEDIAGDLRNWVTAGEFTPPLVVPDAPDVSISDMQPVDGREVVADMLMATGRAGKAESLYRQIGTPGPLALMALRNGQREMARQLWRRALADGKLDANLCYQFALQAQEAGLPKADVKAALERAVTLKPKFQDALYRLALLEQEGAEFAASLKHLQAMQPIAPARAYGYWLAMTHALTELDRRAEAKAAADRARQFAQTEDQRGFATQLGVIALTDPVVRMTRDADGNVRMIAARKPHGEAEWNPFVEPGDQVRQVEGSLREIDCSQPTSVFLVDLGKRVLRLRVPDPGHVLMREAPPEFTCGLQPMNPVVAVYAETDTGSGVLRGLEFR